VGTLRYLGNMSYSFYIMHGITLQGVALLRGKLPGAHLSAGLLFPGALLAGFAATWMVSTVLFLSVGKRFSLKVKPAALGISSRGK
jgi:exopolysaccharide production protein ExoZ